MHIEVCEVHFAFMDFFMRQVRRYKYLDTQMQIGLVVCTIEDLLVDSCFPLVVQELHGVAKSNLLLYCEYRG